MEAFSGYYPKLDSALGPNMSSDIIIEGQRSKGSETVVTIHGCIRATPLVALRGKHWSTNEIPGTSCGARTTKKRSTTLPSAEPGLYHNKTSSWGVGEKQVGPYRGRKIRQVVFPLRSNGGKLGQTRSNHWQEECDYHRWQH